MAVAFAKEAFERDQIQESIARRVANITGQAQVCRRNACRRAGVCSGPECLVEAGPPAKETQSDIRALRALRDYLKASVAAAEAAAGAED